MAHQGRPLLQCASSRCWAGGVSDRGQAAAAAAAVAGQDIIVGCSPDSTACLFARASVAVRVGWLLQDVDVRESMKRGSQGSGGILGYGFNIITGKDRPGGDPHATLRPRDPRVTRNVTERTDQQVDAWGDAGRRRPDLISGRFRPTVREGASKHRPQPPHSMVAQLRDRGEDGGLWEPGRL